MYLCNSSHPILFFKIRILAELILYSRIVSPSWVGHFHIDSFGSCSESAAAVVVVVVVVSFWDEEEDEEGGGSVWWCPPSPSPSSPRQSNPSKRGHPPRSLIEGGAKLSSASISSYCTKASPGSCIIWYIRARLSFTRKSSRNSRLGVLRLASRRLISVSYKVQRSLNDCKK